MMAGKHSRVVTRLLAVLALAFAANSKADTFTLLEADQTAWVEEDQGYFWAHTGETFNTSSRLRTDTRGRLVLSHPSLRITLPERSEITIDTDCHTPGCGYLKNLLSKGARPMLGHPCNGPTVWHHRGTMFVQATKQAISIHAQNIRVDVQNAVLAISTSYSLGQQISVIEGQIKVKNPDASIILVTAGESLRTGDEITPRLLSLDSSPDTTAHLKGLREFQTENLRKNSIVPEIIPQESVINSSEAFKGKQQAEAPQ